MTTKTKTARDFIFCSSAGDLLDVAMQLKFVERKNVVMYITDKKYKSIGDGIVDKDKLWFDYLGKGYVWVFDDCDEPEFQDWLRQQGEHVVGSNEEMAECEDDRQKGQAWFKAAGFVQPFSKNFTSIDDCIKFVEGHNDRKWILKQNGSAPKHLNHKGKFDDGIDMIFHLEELRKEWNEQEYGSFDCDLMEIVTGMEFAVSGFFNGHDWLRNEEGKAVAFINFEEKKEADGDLGETTGEMGTTFFGTDEDNPLVRDTIMNGTITAKLRETDYRGVFDLNCIMTEDGIVVLEATSRFGIPTTSYTFIEGLRTPTGDVLAAMARGEDMSVDIVEGWGMVMVVVAKPFPVEADIEDRATSIGEKLWLLRNGDPIEDFTPEQRRHVHLNNYLNIDGTYKVASKLGYLLTVTGTGDSIEETRADIISYIKKNIYVPGMKYRSDIGERVEQYANLISKKAASGRTKPAEKGNGLLDALKKSN